MADDFPAGAVAIVRRHIEDEHDYPSWPDTHVGTIERGRVVMVTPYDEKLTNTVSPLTIHGGIMATLIDTTGDIALRTMLGDPFTGDVATINLSVSYLRRASGDLTAIAGVVHAGGLVGVNTVTVVSTDPEKDSDVVARQSSSSDWNDVAATG